MTALAKEKFCSFRYVVKDVRPMKAGVRTWKNGLVECSAGFFGPVTAGSGKRIVGRATLSVDNTGGTAGQQNVEVNFFYQRELILLVNSSVNPVTAAMRETLCYGEDDQTVGSLATGYSPAGLVYDVTTEGVWVEVATKV